MNSRSTLLDLKDIAFQSYSESPRVHLYIQIEYWSESQSTPHTSIARREQLPVPGLRMLKRSRAVEKRSPDVVDLRVQSMSCSAFQERPKICITDFRHELMSIGSLQRGRKLVIVSNFRDQVAIWKYFGADSTYISLVSLPISRDGWDWKRCIVFSPSVLFSSFLSFCWLVRFFSKYSTNFDR